MARYATCRWCGAYKHKCKCRHIPFIFSINAKFPQGPFHNVNVKRAIGLEFELSEWNNLEAVLLEEHPDLVSKLRLERVFDRSVEPSHHELTVGPVAGDAILTYLPQLLSIMQHCKVETNKTCSLHVHVDARDLFAWDIRSFLLLYLQWEHDFNRLFPVSRIYPPSRSAHGGFAKPWPASLKTAIKRLKDATSTHTIKALLAFGVYNIYHLDYYTSRDFINSKSTRYTNIRYHGCNVHSYLSRGTIEFRQHEGTITGEAILWGLFAAAFVDLVARPKAYDNFHNFTLSQFVKTYFTPPLVKWFNARQAAFAGEWRLHDTKAKRRVATR